MKIVMMGAGGLGGYIGGQLARAGRDVSFIARGEQLKAFHSNGLEVRGVGATFRVPQVMATDDPQKIDSADLIIVGVKTYDLAGAIESMRAMVGPRTSILPILNGVDHVRVLNESFGMQCVLGGLSSMTAHVVSPGVVERVGNHGILEFGDQSGEITPRAEEIAAILSVDGLKAKASAGILESMWQKLAMICGAAVCCVVRGDKATVARGNPETSDLVRQLATEVVRVGQAMQVGVEDTAIEATVKLFDSVPLAFKPSMLVGLERGQRLELEALNGAVVRMGKEVNVPTPANAFVYACLKPYASGRLAG